MILSKGKENVLVIPDLQMPFHHKDALDFLSLLKAAVQPTKVVCIGDSMDGNALSRWTNDPDGMSPGDEYKKALESLHELYEIFPTTQEVISNHNERIAKRAYDGGVPAAFLRSYEEIMQYPRGWSLHRYVEIDGVIYEHGHRHGGMYAARRAAVNNGQSTVVGHHHSHAGVFYIAPLPWKMFFGMNVGCLLDMETYAFNYAKEATFKPTMGAGVVIEGVPFFIPMLLDENYRWIGDIIL